MLYQQVQTELVISILVVAVTNFIFWQLALASIGIAWGAAIIFSVGGRSLFISRKNNEADDSNSGIRGEATLSQPCLPAAAGVHWGSTRFFSHRLCNRFTPCSPLPVRRFALDDFGVGLSSFSYLKNLAVNYLKLDGCFVRNMLNDNINKAMVEAINKIGHTMNIETIAEFVEDEATLNAVRRIGVDYAQGYVISRPMPIEIGLYSDTPVVIPPAPEEDRPVALKTYSGSKK